LSRRGLLILSRSWRLTRTVTRSWFGAGSRHPAHRRGGWGRRAALGCVVLLRRAAQMQVVHLGSLAMTLLLLGLLGAVVVAGLLPQGGAGAASGGVSGLAVALVMVLLAFNLGMGLLHLPALTRRLPLLIFHVALLLLALLVGVGRLTALDGRFELTQGVVYEGQLIDSQVGTWHRGALEKLVFRHEGFEIDYAPGRKRGATRNQVSWVDEHGTVRTAVIGDHHPLVIDGYRIYTSPNKGFAPVLSWLPADVPPPPPAPGTRAHRHVKPVKAVGAVHLPSYPANELRQSREWTLPDGRSVWVKLDFDETLIDSEQAASFRLPSQHTLVVRLGDDKPGEAGQRAELQPGQGVDLPGGRLVYEGLRSWMGYRISYDPTLPWLLACALLAVWSLAWHYLRKFIDPRRPAAAPRPLAGT
jgi:cytochrome c biogenesis protein